MITGSALISGGLHASQLAALAVVVLTAGLLVGRRAAVGATLASAATVLGLAALEALGFLVVDDFQQGTMERSLILLAMLGGSQLVLAMALRRIENSRAKSAAFETELEQRNAELELAHERYREINDLTSEHFYSMPVGTDAALANELTSPQFKRITGYDPSELTAKLYWKLIHPEDRARLTALEDAPTQERSSIKEYRFLTKAGETVWIRDHSRIIVNQDGTARLYGASRDITDEKRASLERDQMQVDLRQAQKMEAVGRLAGGIAHDFNNLLTVIAGFSEMLAEQIEGDEASESVEQIRVAADRASELTAQLMAFSRRPLGIRDTVDINGVIGALGPMLARLLGEDIDVVMNLAPDAGHAKGEPSLFEQVIVNLAVNARDAMPKGGTLRFATALINEGSQVCIEVRDTGIGITEEVAAHVFEPFYTTKALGEGTGLGLATVYGIVQRFGGTIHLETEVGKGSCFELRLPTASPVAADTNPPSPLATPVAPKTVLVVEDEDRVRQLVRSALEAQGHTVLEANCAAAALDEAAKSVNTIDLLVTDVVMPGMDGFELSRILQKQDPKLRVLIMSGYAKQRAGSRRQVPEDATFLQKPFGPRDLAAKLTEIFG